MCQKAHPDRRLFCVRVQRAHVAAAGRSKSACTACQRRGGHAAAAINETKTLPHVAAIPSPACGTVRHEIRPSAKQSVGEAPALAGRRIRRRLRRAARFVDGRRTPSQWADPNSGRHGEIGRAAGRRRRSNNSRNQHEHRQPAQEAARSLVLVLRPPRRKRGSCEKQRMRLTCVLTNRSSPYIAYPVRPPGPWSRKTMSHFARRAWHVPLPCQKVRRPEPTGRTRGSVFVCISDVSPLYPFCKSTCTHHHANALPPDNCVQLPLRAGHPLHRCTQRQLHAAHPRLAHHRD